MPMQDPQFDDDQYLDEYNQGFDGRSLPGMGPSMSFGERIGAKKMPVQATPDAAQAKVEDTQAPPQLQLDPQKLPPEITRTTLKPSEIPTPAASSPVTNTLPDLMRRRSDAAKPIDPGAVDPATKKPMYRMGTGQRVLGTIANALNGFSRNGAPVVDVGPGATNNRYSRAVGMQEKQLGALDTDIGNQEKLGEQQRKLYEDATKQAYEGELGTARLQAADAAAERAKAAGETADVKGQLAASQQQLNEARARQAEAAGNQKDATRPTKVMGLRTYEKQDDGTWKDVGPAPTKQFSPNSGRAKQSEFDKIERDKQNQLRQAELKARQSIAKLKPFDLADPRPKAERERDIYDQLEQDKTQAQADYEARIAEKGGTVNSPPAQRTVNTPPPNQVRKPGQNEARVSVLEKATGKRGTIPQSQLKAALASGKYSQ